MLKFIPKNSLYRNCRSLVHYFTSWLVGHSTPALYFRKTTNQTPAIPVKLIFCWILCALLQACTAVIQHTDTADPNSLASLQSMSNKKHRIKKAHVMSKVRAMALKETALSIGAQSGLAWRAKYIDDELIKLNNPKWGPILVQNISNGTNKLALGRGLAENILVEYGD